MHGTQKKNTEHGCSEQQVHMNVRALAVESLEFILSGSVVTLSVRTVRSPDDRIQPKDGPHKHTDPVLMDNVFLRSKCYHVKSKIT
jgi:hypothetical protein